MPTRFLRELRPKDRVATAFMTTVRASNPAGSHRPPTTSSLPPCARPPGSRTAILPPAGCRPAPKAAPRRFRRTSSASLAPFGGKRAVPVQAWVCGSSQGVKLLCYDVIFYTPAVVAVRSSRDPRMEGSHAHHGSRSSAAVVVVPSSAFARNPILAEAPPDGRARVEFVNDGTPLGRSPWEGSPGEQLLTSSTSYHQQRVVAAVQEKASVVANDVGRATYRYEAAPRRVHS